MGKFNKFSSRIDSSQEDICNDLKRFPFISVAKGYDDILLGCKGKTYWFELKSPDKLKKDGTFKKGAIRESQIELRNLWQGHYRIAWMPWQIYFELGVRCGYIIV